MTVLDSLTLDITFEKRYELKGHTIAYKSMHRDGSILRCTECGRSVELRVNDLGGWWTSNRDLDKECAVSGLVALFSIKLDALREAKIDELTADAMGDAEDEVPFKGISNRVLDKECSA